MHSCDVLIIGGGPAGSSCARGLRGSGLNVMLVDRAIFPREKLCGGWVTPLIFSELEIDIDEYSHERTLQPITGFKVGVIGQQEVFVDCGHVVSYGIRRCEFDEFLIRRCGAHVREGVSVNTIQRTARGWLINNEIQTRMLVGAGGHFCPVAKAMCDGTKQAVVAQEIEFEMSQGEAVACNISNEVPELFFCRDLSGYGWCFRKGNFLNIGLGRLDHHRLRDHLDQFVRILIDHGKITLDRSLRFGGHAYLLFGNSSRKVVDDSVLLAGDSAGLAFPESGEGIRPAIESGLLAARVITAAEGAYTLDHLSLYTQLLKERFARPSRVSGRVSEAFPSFVRSAFARMLLRNPAFCRKVVTDWFLRTDDQPLPPISNQIPASQIA